jgi:hypothetical protein
MVRNTFHILTNTHTHIHKQTKISWSNTFGILYYCCIFNATQDSVKLWFQYSLRDHDIHFPFCWRQRDTKNFKVTSLVTSQRHQVRAGAQQKEEGPNSADFADYAWLSQINIHQVLLVQTTLALSIKKRMIWRRNCAFIELFLFSWFLFPSKYYWDIGKWK